MRTKQALTRATEVALAFALTHCTMVVGDGSYTLIEAGGSGATTTPATGPSSNLPFTLDGAFVPDSGDAASSADGRADDGAARSSAIVADAQDAGPAPATEAAGSLVDASTDLADGSVQDANTPSETGDCADCVKVFYRSTGSGDTIEAPEVSFGLCAAGSGSIDLSTVTVRYYFTADGCLVAALRARCDSAMLNSSKVPCPNVRFVAMSSPRPTADTYAEFSFTGVGVLAPTTTLSFEGEGAYFGEGFGCSFRQSNDYSYSSTAGQFSVTRTMTAYVGGTLVWGAEP